MASVPGLAPWHTQELLVLISEPVLFPSWDSRVPHFTTSPEFPVTGPFLLPSQP